MLEREGMREKRRGREQGERGRERARESKREENAIEAEIEVIGEFRKLGILVVGNVALVKGWMMYII